MNNVTTLDLPLEALCAAREEDRFDLNTRYGNAMMVRVLRTIGYDVGFVRGEGAHLYDRAGTRYLDLLSGWGVFGIGRNHPRLREILTGVLDSHFANLVQMDVSLLAGLLAERLIARVPYLEKVLFASTGSEAVETAIKFARRATGRPGLVHCAHSFHGLTYGALSMTGEDNFRDGFTPLLPDTHEIAFNDLASLEEVLASRRIAAFILEPIQGKTVDVAGDLYLKDALQLCRKYGTLLIADEVQTGLGRTGRFLAVEHSGIEPDMVLLSKTLSGGYVPVSAVLLRKWIFDKVFDRMDRAVIHGSTFGANDLAMAAGIATLEVMESERIVENAARQGARLKTALETMAKDFELVADVHGRGLMLGITFASPRSLKLRAAWHALEAMNKGLFCQLITLPLFKEHKILVQVAGHASHTVKLLPTLVLSDADCDWIETAFRAVIKDAHRVPGAVWSLGKTLADQALRARAAA